MGQITGTPRSNFPAGFWSWVDRTGECWLWTGAVDRKGYGKYWVVVDGNRRCVQAHRIAYELEVGPIPAGLWALHRCDTPPCVRPTHVFLGTAQDNSNDMVAKGRGPLGDKNGSRKHPDRLRAAVARRVQSPKRGSDHGNAKLTETDVMLIRAIRRNIATPIRVIAQAFGVSDSNIRLIVAGKAWTHVPMVLPGLTV